MLINVFYLIGFKIIWKSWLLSFASIFCLLVLFGFRIYLVYIKFIVSSCIKIFLDYTSFHSLLIFMYCTPAICYFALYRFYIKIICIIHPELL